jgi:hypothetical protein
MGDEAVPVMGHMGATLLAIVKTRLNTGSALASAGVMFVQLTSVMYPSSFRLSWASRAVETLFTTVR